MVKQKKSSQISARQAFEILTTYVGYDTIAADPNREIRPTQKSAVRAHPDIVLSKSGKSIVLHFAGRARYEEPRAATITIPAKGMLSLGEKDTIERLARIKFEDYLNDDYLLGDREDEEEDNLDAAPPPAGPQP